MFTRTLLIIAGCALSGCYASGEDPAVGWVTEVEAAWRDCRELFPEGDSSPPAPYDLECSEAILAPMSRDERRCVEFVLGIMASCLSERDCGRRIYCSVNPVNVYDVGDPAEVSLFQECIDEYPGFNDFFLECRRSY